MAIVVDSPVWSLAYRRRQTDLNTDETSVVRELQSLILGGQAVLLGAVRQEVLSGLRSELQFEELRMILRNFSDPEVRLEDYEEAARLENICRAAGFAATDVDMLICAIASRMNAPVFTLDQDFVRYSRVLPFLLHPVAGRA